MELNNNLICRSFLPSINVRISELMLLLIFLRAAGVGAGEDSVVGTCVGVVDAGSGGMGTKPVERGVGGILGICICAHVWIIKELRNSKQLGAGKIRAWLRVRVLMDFQYTKVQSCTDQSN